ncbi:DUF3099 domain-containing protein [Nocardioides daejeonensis]|uniref:DUF3099 domain-containing protein n=1 Tax=Nocardioides daejeonensis TaxID=1046556 RepID=UPI000D744C59|nr:DUF3099 domain-containing protein [Nocardioides daejeonensis]
MSARGPRHHDDAIRITTAAPSPDAEIRDRQRRYLLSMLVRTVCFVGAVAVGPGWFRWILVIGAVFLPYVAVVFANAMPGKPREADLPSAPWGHELPHHPTT